ncbi:hypothetical protein ACFOU2_21140 [Bacillus songklensis]|uniref:Uncharacterized protein n=1 Tax=Bacillus songklensis TaxID=1069116 RepID=A0ABV8B8V6_9BACI
MNTLQSIYQDVRQIFQQGTQSVKDKLTSLFQHETMTVEEIADFIQHHPNTMRTQQTLLGITYHFYHLHLEEATFYMEAKGKQGEHILYATAYIDSQVLFTYRSYGENPSLNKKVAIHNFH